MQPSAENESRVELSRCGEMRLYFLISKNARPYATRAGSGAFAVGRSDSARRQFPVPYFVVCIEIPARPGIEIRVSRIAERVCLEDVTSFRRRSPD